MEIEWLWINSSYFYVPTDLTLGPETYMRRCAWNGRIGATPFPNSINADTFEVVISLKNNAVFEWQDLVLPAPDHISAEASGGMQKTTVL